MLAKRAAGFISRLEAGFKKDAFSYLLALRLIPAAPFWVVNIVPALLGMRLAPFFIATFIGIAPGTSVYVAVGHGFDKVLAKVKFQIYPHYRIPILLPRLWRWGFCL